MPQYDVKVRMAEAGGRHILFPTMFPSNRVKNVLLAVLVWAAWTPRPAAAKDTVRIISLSPPADNPLRVGDAVDFEITLDLDVTSAPSRRLHVWITSGSPPRSQILAAWTQIQPNGRSTLAFKRIVRVPESGRISVQAAIAERFKPFLAFEARDYDLIDRSGKRIKAEPSPEDKVRIDSIKYASGSTLRIGSTVAFALNANYDLRSREAGRLVWGLASSGDVQTILASEPVRKGKGKVAVRRELQMPGTDANAFFFVLLLPDGSVRGTALDRKRFQVKQPAKEDHTTTSQITVSVAGRFEDRLRIVSISPTPEKALQVGQVVNFDLEVEYELNSLDAAQLDVTFGTGVDYARDSQIIYKGQGSLSVKTRLWLATGIDASFPVQVRLPAPANARDTAMYKIEP